jgi:DNA-binding MarR family transcriptional regulator
MADVHTIRDPKDLRLRKQLFPDGESLVFDTSQKGFVPLPILLRKAIRHLSPPELRALVYLALRASRYGICYPTQEEIAYEVGLEGTKNLQPVLKSLERKRFITTRMSMGKKFYLVHDPLVGIQKLLDDGKISDEELTDINNLCEDLGRPPLRRAVPPPPPA